MSNSRIFTQAAFAEFAKGLLVDHSVSFTNEEGDTESYKKGGDHNELAEDVFSVDTGMLTIANESGVSGNAWLINEYSEKHGETVTDIYNNGMSVEHLMPSFDDEE